MLHYGKSHTFTSSSVSVSAHDLFNCILALAADRALCAGLAAIQMEHITMMFMRVTKPAFYDAVRKLQNAARRNEQTFNRRESTTDSDTLRISYEVNGVPNAQAVKHAAESAPRFYVLK